MTSGARTIVYPVKDLAAARAVFTELLGTPQMDEVYYVGWNVAGQDIGLDPNGHAKGTTGPVPYWTVPDIHSSLKSLLEAGASTVQDVKDVGGGKLVASVRDPNGNPIGLIQEA
jgi:predicted enzyme related to lactoylglutathione lyase